MEREMERVRDIERERERIRHCSSVIPTRR